MWKPTVRWGGAAFLAWTLSWPAAAETLRLATGELPPYATAGANGPGAALEIVRAALRTQGHDVVYTFMPWGRALEETRAGKWDGTAYWGRQPAHEQSFLLSDNVLTEEWVVLHRAGLSIDWQEPEDLAPYLFAAIRSYTYTPRFHALFASGRLRVDWTPDDVAALRKLASGRVDVVMLDRHVACTLMEQHLTPEQAKGLRAHPRLITDAFTTHVLLPKALPASAARQAVLNQGLASLRASGEYRRLLTGRRCSVNLDSVPAAAAAASEPSPR